MTFPFETNLDAIALPLNGVKVEQKCDWDYN